MASISDIATQVEFPRIGALAGTPEENHLIELWRWGILTQIYSRIAINNMQFGPSIIQEDVKIIWDKTMNFVETEQNGEADIIDILPFMINHAMERIKGVDITEFNKPELAEEDMMTLEWWFRKAVYFVIWSKFQDRSPSSDSLDRVRTWIEGKIVRDYDSSDALENIRYKIVVTLHACDAILKGTLPIK